MPFGVELPDNLGQNTAQGDAGATGGTPPNAGAAPEGSAPPISENQNGTQAQVGTPAQPTLTDLDKLERFLFKGRETTRKELEDGWLRQADYTRKSQELAEQRKYAEHFVYDLRTVIADRSKFAEFEKLYPKVYVDRAKEILAQLNPASQTAPNNASPSLKDDPDFQAIKSEFQEWKQAQKETEIARIQSWIDNQFDRLSKKYPNAHPEIVNNRAWSASNQGQQITEEVLEKLFKTNDEEMKKRMDETYQTKINQQLKANKTAKDVGSGGDISGGAPKKYRTIKDATAGFLADIDASKAR